MKAAMSDSAPLARYPDGRFGPGNPGRRAGARNKMSHRAAMAILEDFEVHKDKLMEGMRYAHKVAYFTAMLQFVGRHLENGALDEPLGADDE
jgi:hypothetical protein